MSAPLIVHVIRHGEVHNPQAILYGRLPGYRLSEAGRQQAAAAGQWLAGRPLAALYVSPMERAQETAQIIAAQQPAPPLPQTDERLNEVHTTYDGTPHEVLELTQFDIYTDAQAPYERPPDVRRRLRAFIAEMRQRHAGQEIAAVTHGDVVVAAFLFAMQHDENDIGRGQLERLGLPERYPVTASINTFTYDTAHADEIPRYRYLRPY